MLISGKWSFVGSKAGVGEGKYEVEIAGEVREEVGVVEEEEKKEVEEEVEAEKGRGGGGVGVGGGRKG